MRDIKFRAWDSQFCIMQDVIQINYQSNLPVMVKGASLPMDSLMQYTGLKDKNGVDEKDVYAGDKIIVTDGDGEAIGAVTMNDKTGQWVWVATEVESLALTVFVGREIPLYRVLDEQTRWNGCLIGNIHETPELLK